MTRRTSAFLFLLASGAMAAPPARKTAPQPTNFQERVEQYWKAWSSGDEKAIRGFYSTGPDAVFYDIGPLQHKGWDQYRLAVERSSTRGEQIEVTLPEKVAVHKRGALVWTTNTVHIKIQPASGPAREWDARQTLIWERRGPRWVILHEHLSVPMDVAQ
jgi:ketosteroid isomerase-like protein